MSIVVGLDPRIYIKSAEDVTPESIHVFAADILEVIEKAENNNVKYLYNGHMDEWLPNSIKNIFTELKNDIAYVALVSTPFEYIETIFAHDPAVHDDKVFNFEEPVQGYIYGIFNDLIERYNHGIVISNNEEEVTINNNLFYFCKDMSSQNDLTVNMLPSITNYDDVKRYFTLYNWFFGKEEKKIILSDTFIRQIYSLVNDEIYNIVTSIFRGVYYPDYLISQGFPSCQYTLEAHSDSSTKQMYVNSEKTTLFRIHCVDMAKQRGGVKRICYTENSEYVFVFYYHEDHCNKLSHVETIEYETIKIFDKDRATEDRKYKIKAKI